MSRPPAPLRVESLEARDVPATVGAPDPSFGTSGQVVADFGGTESAAGVVVQPNGKVVVVGTSGATNDIVLARYNPDGTPDATFGGGTGTFTFGFGGTDTAAGIALQADGRFVVVGSTDVGGSAGFAVARVLADGSGLDPSFDGDGKVVVEFDLGGANEDRAAAVALQADGRIVVVGSVQVGAAAANTDFGIVRLTATGALDTTFDTDGKRTVAFDLGGANEDRATAVAVSPGGRLVVAGYAEGGAGAHEFAAARLSATDGSLDTTFDTDGKATVDFGGDDVAYAVAVRPDGRVVLAGATDGTQSRFAVAQLTFFGVLDTAFAGTGKLAFSFNESVPGGAEAARAVALDGDGRVVLVGGTDNTAAGTDNVGVARVLADGSGLDQSFGTGGKVQADFGGEESGAAVALDGNGRVVVAGTTSLNGNVVVARFIGGVEKAPQLAVSGSPDGKAVVIVPSAAGVVPETAVALLGPFGDVAVSLRGATGDVNGDGVPDSVLVTGPGTPIRVAVISGVDHSTLLVAPFDPFGGDFTGGGFVAVGDFDTDGRAEFVITPDQGGGPRVSVFSLLAAGVTLRANFFGIDDPDFRGGVRAAAGDVNGDGRPELVVAAGFGGGPRVAVFNGATVFGTPTRLVSDFFAFPGTDAVDLRNGAFVAAGDVNGDGFAELIFGGGPGGAPRVFALSGALVAAGNVAGAQAAPVSNFFVGGRTADRGGVRVAAADLDGDNKADVVTASGDGRPGGLRVYLGKNVTAAAEPTAFQDVTLYGGGILLGGVFVG
jgi:uncharacterized delta-60 repeat protein